MFRTASTTLARRRYSHHLSTSPSSSSTLVNHPTILHFTSISNQNSTVLLPPTKNNVTSKPYKSKEPYTLLNNQGMMYHQPIAWKDQSIQLRFMSTNNNKNNLTGGESSGTSDLGNIKKGDNDGNDKLLFGLDQKRLLVGMGIFTVGSAIISLPVATRYMQQVQQEYKEEEVEIDDELYQRMKDISAEVEGEITQRLLGEELSKKLIEGGKKKAVDNTVSLITDVINSDALQNAITTLFSNIVTSSQFKGACQMLLKNLWDDLVTDPETTAQVVALLNTAIKDERIKDSFKELILGLLKDEEVKRELTSLVVQLGEEKEVLDATRELLTESAHRALNDPEILDHSMEFATDVVGDNVLQRTSGEALRNTVTYAVKPSLSTFLSVFGISLLFFSASALGKARMSAREGREIDAAVSVVAKSIGNNFLSNLGKILSIPVKVVSGLTSVITATLLFPFQMIGRAAGALISAGNTAAHSVFDIFTKASSLPAFMKEIAKMSFSALTISASNLTRQSWQWIASMSGVIASGAKIWLSSAVIFVRDGLKSSGVRAYSSVVSALIATGMRLSNLINSVYTKSSSSLHNTSKQMIMSLSDMIARLISVFRRTNTV